MKHPTYATFQFLSRNDGCLRSVQSDKFQRRRTNVVFYLLFVPLFLNVRQEHPHTELFFKAAFRYEEFHFPQMSHP